MDKKMASNLKKKKRKVVGANNFLEALRNLGSGMAEAMVEDVAKGIPQAALNQIIGRGKSGELKPDQELNVKQLSQEAEEKKRETRHFQQEFLDLRRQERLIWARAEQETKLQISAILEELKKLIASTSQLSKEVKIAAQQVPVEPGTYHLSFFERLRQTIRLFKKRIEESATWLATFNQRAKKRNYYWAQVKKSGTKFMLSSERYMATQAG